MLVFKRNKTSIRYSFLFFVVLLLGVFHKTEHSLSHPSTHSDFSLAETAYAGDDDDDDDDDCGGDSGDCGGGDGDGSVGDGSLPEPTPSVSIGFY